MVLAGDGASAGTTKACRRTSTWRSTSASTAASGVGVNLGLVPDFKGETLEETETYEIYRRTDGVIGKEFKGDLGARMPQWLRFPLRNARGLGEDHQAAPGSQFALPLPALLGGEKRIWAERDYPLDIGGGSIFGWLRNWMSMERICQTLYDDPEWMHEMMDYIADFVVATVHKRAVEEVRYRLCDDVGGYGLQGRPADLAAHVPRVHARALQKDHLLLHEHGVHLIFVDSDGDSGPLFPLWLEGGVTGYYPLERASGMDAAQLRKQYGRQLRLIGGIDKRAMAAGPAAIDAELANVAALVADGGYIPWCDHLVPPDVSFENYMYYVKRMKELTLNPTGYEARR